MDVSELFAAVVVVVEADCLGASAGFVVAGAGADFCVLVVGAAGLDGAGGAAATPSLRRINAANAMKTGRIVCQRSGRTTGFGRRRYRRVLWAGAARWANSPQRNATDTTRRVARVAIIVAAGFEYRACTVDHRFQSFRPFGLVLDQRSRLSVRAVATVRSCTDMFTSLGRALVAVLVVATPSTHRPSAGPLALSTMGQRAPAAIGQAAHEHRSPDRFFRFHPVSVPLGPRLGGNRSGQEEAKNLPSGSPVSVRSMTSTRVPTVFTHTTA